eukprot:gnl/Chilomastix_cuspidata/4516.p1 GENE.gnl/Chilomastix_cuspidata/4516~~gnl/Chilomastix_cuspidata/4516.p1  ORF type:complete len:432 (-),score=194.78 gnl/Chilomastix_cuspidata/4516:156-1451(-)
MDLLHIPFVSGPGVLELSLSSTRTSRLYVADGNGYTSLKFGKKPQNTNLPNITAKSIALTTSDTDHVYLASDNAVYRVGKRSHKPRKLLEITDQLMSKIIVGEGKPVVLVALSGPMVLCWQGGDILFQTNVGSAARDGCLLDGNVCVLATDAGLAVLSAAGALDMRLHPKVAFTCVASISDTQVVAGAADGRVFFFDTALNEEAVLFAAPGAPTCTAVSHALLADECVIAVGHSGGVAVRVLSDGDAAREILIPGFAEEVRAIVAGRFDTHGGFAVATAQGRVVWLPLGEAPQIAVHDPEELLALRGEVSEIEKGLGDALGGGAISDPVPLLTAEFSAERMAIKLTTSHRASALSFLLPPCLSVAELEPACPAATRVRRGWFTVPFPPDTLVIHLASSGTLTGVAQLVAADFGEGVAGASVFELEIAPAAK